MHDYFPRTEELCKVFPHVITNLNFMSIFLGIVHVRKKVWFGKGIVGIQIMVYKLSQQKDSEL